MSKGSKRRPIDPAVERKVFEDNWDRIFNKERKDLQYESDNPLERPFEPIRMWKHECKKERAVMRVAEGQACNWCGQYEDGTND